MTFSLLVRDPGSGAFGSVIASSSPAVAARCVHLRGGVGGVHSQNITDPRLGARLLDLMTQGHSAMDSLAHVVGSEPTVDWRQLAVVDGAGGTAVHSGSRALGVVGGFAVPNAAAAGNLLATPDVPRRMVDGFLAASGDLETRLLAGLRAAVAAGGEAGPVRSAGLTVVTDVGWPVTDLRVDFADDPVDELSRLLDVWLPQRDTYVQRALDPADSPGYGVPGDDR